MNDSSCEWVPRSEGTTSSRIIRMGPNFRWEGVPLAEYKSPGDSWQGVSRMSLLGSAAEPTAFHVRYFEIAPGGFSSLEQHAHAHAVLVLCGQGEVRLGEEPHPISSGDFVYVAPHEVHQFRNTSPTEPFGFICIVDAIRDQPKPMT